MPNAPVSIQPEPFSFVPQSYRLGTRIMIHVTGTCKLLVWEVQTESKPVLFRCSCLDYKFQAQSFEFTTDAGRLYSARETSGTSMRWHRAEGCRRTNYSRATGLRYSLPTRISQSGLCWNRCRSLHEWLECGRKEHRQYAGRYGQRLR